MAVVAVVGLNRSPTMTVAGRTAVVDPSGTVEWSHPEVGLDLVQCAHRVTFACRLCRAELVLGCLGVRFRRYRDEYVTED